MKLLTIAVPSYNVEKTLYETLQSFCVDEIIDQLDVIIVNDGSTDSTVAVANEFAAKYPETFRIISKKNGGHGSAVNCGIEAAQGKYFKVVDGDDRVEKTGFITLINRLGNCDTDIVACNYKKISLKGENPQPMIFENISYNKVYDFNELSFDGKIYFGIHSITIKTSLLTKHNIRLQENTFYVDVEYAMLPVPFVETVEFLDVFVYLYYVGSVGQSINFDNFVNRYDDHYRVVKRMTEYYNQAECSQNHKKYMFTVLNKLCFTHYMLSAFYDKNSFRARQRAAEFDKWLYENSAELYQSLGKSNYLKLLRITKFKILPGRFFKTIIKNIYDILRPVFKKKRKFTY